MADLARKVVEAGEAGKEGVEGRIHLERRARLAVFEERPELLQAVQRTATIVVQHLP